MHLKTLSFLCPFAFAKWSDMINIETQTKLEILNIKKQHLEALGYDDETTMKQLRTFNSAWASAIIEKIDNYGCWCYFQDNHGKGKGSPMNAVDEQCKILQDGYSCIVMDYEASHEEGKGGGCVPWEVKYTSATGLGMLANSNFDEEGDDETNSATLEYALRKKCRKANRNSNCAARACVVENYFVLSMVKLFLNGTVFDPSLLHELGHFDPNVMCTIKSGHFYSEKKCCGDYPIRFPYKTNGGDRGCCAGNTFNSVIMDCCEDGEVRITC